MSLLERVQNEMKAALRAKDTDRLSTIRLLIAAIKQKEVDERITPTDADVLAIVDKMIKQRRDAIAQFEPAGRRDLADKERAEIEVLSAYLPPALGDDALAAEIGAAIAAVGAAGPQDMGKVMGRLKTALAGRADMTRVAQHVKAALAK